MNREITYYFDKYDSIMSISGKKVDFNDKIVAKAIEDYFNHLIPSDLVIEMYEEKIGKELVELDIEDKFNIIIEDLKWDLDFNNKDSFIMNLEELINLGLYKFIEIKVAK